MIRFGFRGIARLFRLWLPALAAVAVMAGSVRGGDMEIPLYKIGTVAWMGWSPLHVAEEKDFWSDQGIAVEVRNFDNPIVILDAMRAGRIDFAMDMAGTVAGLYVSGESVAALAETNWSHGGDKIVIRKGGKLREFVGKPLGVFLRQPSLLYFLHLYLQTQGLGLKDFRIVEVNAEDLNAQFLAGRLPIILNYDPWAGQALQSGQGEVLATSRDFKGCIPECIWAYRKRLRDIPEADVEKILRGWVRAAAWIERPGNWPEFTRILKKRTFPDKPGLSDEEIKREFDNVRIHNAAESRASNRDGGRLEKYFLSLDDFGRSAGLWSRPLRPKDLFDNRHIMKVLDEPRTPEPGRRAGGPGREP